jgi:hypothetical protein
MAQAIGCRSRELSPKSLVFSTVVGGVISASAMGFRVICSLRLSHELVTYGLGMLSFFTIKHNLNDVH